MAAPEGTPPPPDRAWPALRADAWADTRDTLHLWTQIVGKVRLAQEPMLNHWWQTPFYVTARGLTTSAFANGSELVDVELDFVEHELRARSTDGRASSVSLAPKSVAQFYDETLEALRRIGLDARIDPVPREVETQVPFPQDEHHASYDAGAVEAFWRQLIAAHRVMRRFRSPFIGKASPVHFFWGGFDLVVTVFSGRPAPIWTGTPLHVSASVMAEAESHENSNAGFWPGGDGEGQFYAYAYPEPAGYPDRPVLPEGAHYDPDLREFLLPYEAVRSAPDPDAALLAFYRTTYDAAAELAGWDRAALETAWPARG
ncbi:DUF5996 family protein [Cellulomonas chengniuliangii]|uniref:DUF5996 family protein n=1 Tax=Cellulomonas chengniuliangii TaxID=2968084 RepID=UPI001D0EAD13|nr:DUF5996 family protein [Cellulomonas chengniuliangii]MCC2318136.1 DUF5996 family protein [Cellulomonas chengniuliangii]